MLRMLRLDRFLLSFSWPPKGQDHGQNRWMQTQVEAWRESMRRANLQAFLTTGGFGGGFGDWPPTNWFQPWMPQLLNSWRFGVDGDIWVFASGDLLFTNALLHIDHAALWADYVGPGHIVDADILPILQLTRTGRVDPSDFSPDTAKAIAGMQAMLAAPLIVDNFPDPITMHESFSQIMTNCEFIAVDQDPLCQMGRVVASNDTPGLQVWSKPLVDGARAVALLNRGDTRASMGFDYERIGLAPGVATIRDVWQQAIVAYSTNSYFMSVKPKFAQLLRVTPGVHFPVSPGTTYLSELGWLAGCLNGASTNQQGGVSERRIYRNAVHHPAANLNHYVPTNMTMNGRIYEKGLGLWPNGSLKFFLGGCVASLHAEFGMDDLALGNGKSIKFQVQGDGNLLWESGSIMAGQPPVMKDLDLTGVQILEIVTLATGPDRTGCWADVGDAYLRR